jgi:hypothetical protein
LLKYPPEVCKLVKLPSSITLPFSRTKILSHFSMVLSL